MARAAVVGTGATLPVGLAPWADARHRGPAPAARGHRGARRARRNRGGHHRPRAAHGLDPRLDRAVRRGHLGPGAAGLGRRGRRGAAPVRRERGGGGAPGRQHRAGRRRRAPPRGGGAEPAAPRRGRRGRPAVRRGHRGRRRHAWRPCRPRPTRSGCGTPVDLASRDSAHRRRHRGHQRGRCARAALRRHPTAGPGHRGRAGRRAHHPPPGRAREGQHRATTSASSCAAARAPWRWSPRSRLRLVARPEHVAVALLAFDDVDAAVTAAAAIRAAGPGSRVGRAHAGLGHRSGAPSVRPTRAVRARSGRPWCWSRRPGRRTPPRRWVGRWPSCRRSGRRAVAEDAAGRAHLWAYREEHTLAISTQGVAAQARRHAAARPVGRLHRGRARPRPGRARRTAQVWLFGHVADGNVHVNVTGAEPDDERIDDVVLTLVAASGGSISAEHGIGTAEAPVAAPEPQRGRDRRLPIHQGCARPVGHPEPPRAPALIPPPRVRSSRPRRLKPRARATPARRGGEQVGRS